MLIHTILQSFEVSVSGACSDFLERSRKCVPPGVCAFIARIAKPASLDQRQSFLAAAMAGDVNLFLNDPDDASAAEIEVMIAEEKW
jgi:hypothetical protein